MEELQYEIDTLTEKNKDLEERIAELEDIIKNATYYLRLI